MKISNIRELLIIIASSSTRHVSLCIDFTINIYRSTNTPPAEKGSYVITSKSPSSMKSFDPLVSFPLKQP